VAVDRLRLLLRFGEDGVVQLLLHLAVQEHQVEGGGLDPCAQVEDVISLG
jgi:hypothetical protein